MPVLFPIGIQFSAFLFAQNATVFNKLEGKITYFPFSSSCIPIWRKKKSFSRRKENCGVCISLWAHDGPLQFYQHRGINKLFYYNTHENQKTLKFLFIYTSPLFSFQSAPFEIWHKYLNSSQSRRKNDSGSSQEELQFHAFVIKFIFCFVHFFPLAFSCSFWTSNYPLDTPTWTLIKHHWIPKIHIPFLQIALLYK